MKHEYKQPLKDILEKLSQYPADSTVEINYDEVPYRNRDTCVIIRNNEDEVIGELPFGQY